MTAKPQDEDARPKRPHEYLDDVAAMAWSFAPDGPPDSLGMWIPLALDDDGVDDLVREASHVASARYLSGQANNASKAAAEASKAATEAEANARCALDQANNARADAAGLRATERRRRVNAGKATAMKQRGVTKKQAKEYEGAVRAVLNGTPKVGARPALSAKPELREKPTELRRAAMRWLKFDTRLAEGFSDKLKVRRVTSIIGWIDQTTT